MDKRLYAEQLRRALQLFTSSLSEDKALEVPSVYPAWKADMGYTAGEIIAYGNNPVGDPQLYKVVKDHMSQAIYPPGAGTESLYTAIGLDDSGYAVWAQPSGAHDAYSTGDVVNYKGGLYESLRDGNVWSPEVYPTAWKKVPDGEDPGGEPPEWVQPTGAHDAYNTGDRVTYNGKVYESTMDGNVWVPGVAGWTEVVE